MKINLIFMLCSGLVQMTVASNRLRVFNYSYTETGSKFSNDEARENCKEKSTTLATLIDNEDAHFLTQYLIESINDLSPIETFWIGLQKNRSKTITWSNCANVTNITQHQITNDQRCGAMKEELEFCNCSDPKPFMCDNGTDYILIRKEKNWCEAQSYCRRHHGDLVSYSNDMQKQQIIEQIEDKPVWIGLLHDAWEWDDRVCSTYREWTIPANEESFAVFTMSGMTTIEKDSCAYVLCSKGHRRIKLINELKTWEQAIDYCKNNYADILLIEDEEDQEAVEQWLNFTDATRAASSYWIGLRQSSVFGFWIWKDRVVDYHNWEADQTPEFGSHQCGVIDQRTHKWRDQDCLEKLPFLCEEEIFVNRNC